MGDIGTVGWILIVCIYLNVVFLLSAVGAGPVSRWLDRQLEKLMPTYSNRHPHHDREQDHR